MRINCAIYLFAVTHYAVWMTYLTTTFKEDEARPL